MQNYPTPSALIEQFPRFWSKVDFPDDMSQCWLWAAYINWSGYGSFWSNDLYRMDAAHRVSYELLRGPIPEDLVIDHLCRTRSCTNAFHMEPVTHAVNIQRGREATKTHCKWEHEYNDINTRYTTDQKGGTERHCRPCDRRRGIEWEKRKKLTR